MSQLNQFTSFSPTSSGLDHDTELKFLSDGDGKWRMNCRYGVNNDSVGVIENIQGNEQIQFPLPIGSNVLLGTTYNITDRTIIYFLYNSHSQHSIVEFNTETLTSSFIQEANPNLNFGSDRYINHIGIIDGLLFWTESFARDFDIDSNDNNPPQELNLEKARGGHAYTKQELEVIKRPPVITLQPNYGIDKTKDVNNIKDKMFQFCIRYIYDNNEHSVMGMYSEVASPILMEGYIEVGKEIYNYINLQHTVEHLNVQTVEFYVRQGNKQSFWKFYEKKVSNLYLETINYNFYNSESKSPIADQELVNYDAVPQKASALIALNKNRIVFADNIEGYDNVDLDVTMTPFYKKNRLGEEEISVTFTEGGFAYHTYIEIPLCDEEWVAGDIMALIIQSATTSPTVPDTQIVYKVTQEDIDDCGVFRGHVIDKINATAVPAWFNGASAGDPPTPSYFFAVQPSNAGSPSASWICLITSNFDGDVWLIEPNQLSLVIKNISSVRTHTKGARHEYGIVYFDEQMRHGDVNTDKNSQFDVASRHTANTNQVTEYYNTASVVNGLFHIDHTPPDWAYYYAPVRLKKSTINSLLYMLIGSSLSVIGDNNISIDIFTEIGASADDYISSQLDAYVFKPKDRMRFLYTQKSDRTYPFRNIIDVEVLGTVDETTSTETVVMTEEDLFGDVKKTTTVTTTVVIKGLKTSTSTSTSTGSVTKPLKRTSYDDPTVTSVAGKKIIVENFDTSNTGRTDGYIIDGDTVVEIYSPRSTFADKTEPFYEVGVIHECKGTGGTIAHFGGIKTQGETYVSNSIQIFYGGLYFTNLNFNDKILFDLLNVGDEVKIYYSGAYQTHTVDVISATAITFTVAPPSGYHNMSIPKLYGSTLLPLYSGDAYIRLRQASVGRLDATRLYNNYVVESHSYSDFYNSDVHDYGRLHIVNPYGRRQRMKASLRYGGNYINNTQINKLNNFNGLDLLELPIKYGSVNVLKEVGYVLKAITDSKNISIYIGRKSTAEADGSSNLILTNKVLGTVSVPNEDYGTIHPESAIVQGRWLYFADAINEVIVRDSPNGMIPISGYKMNNYFNAMIKHNYDRRIISGVDKEFGEVIFSFMSAPIQYNNYKTIIFDEQSNRWKSFMGFYPEMYGHLGDTFVSFVGGNLWVHNTNSVYNNFYNVQSAMEVDVIANIEPKQVKIFQNLAFESNINTSLYSTGNWEIPSIRVNTPQGYMLSRLKSNKFKKKENRYYSEILKDMGTPGISSAVEALLSGRPMRGEVAEIKFVNNYTDYAKLIKVTTGVNISDLSF